MLGEGRRGAAEQRQLAIDDDVVADVDAPAPQVVHEIRLRARIDHHEQGSAAREIARERRMLLREQRTRRPGDDHDAGVRRNLALRRQQQRLDLVALVLERIGGAREAFLAGRPPRPTSERSLWPSRK